MSSFLTEMIASRSARIRQEYGTLEPGDLERIAAGGRRVRDFGAALVRPDVAVIGEVKKASPSAGPIAPCCEASKQALHYQRGGASAISVLTEPDHFAGSFTDLSDVADAVDVPVLAKDFVVDPAQLFVARGHGADAVLLMVSVLGKSVDEYHDLALTLGLETLIEVHDHAELRIAIETGARVIGVNSRNLATLEVDPTGARDVIREAADAGVVVVAESGVRTRSDVEAAAAAGACSVLVGETLMRSEVPEETVEGLTGVVCLDSHARGDMAIT